MNTSQLDDEELITKLRQDESSRNNSDLLKELVCRFEGEVLKECCRYLKNREEVQDVSQEVWIRVITKLPQFDSTRKLRPWLFTIVRNRCLDHIQQNKKLLHQELSLKIVDSLQEEIDTDDITRPNHELLEEIMEKVSGQGKLILLLKYNQGWSIKEIQNSLGISESAVKMRLARTREKIQHLFDVHRRNQ